MREIETLCRKLRLDERPEVRRALIAARIDPSLGERLYRLLESRIPEKGLDPFMPFPRENEVAGDITLGRIVPGNVTLGLLDEELTMHTLIVGRTGAGKTNLVYHILQQLIPRYPVLIFDFKRDYRHLIRMFPSLVVVSPRELRINPLRPPEGVEIDRWLEVVGEMFSEPFGLLTGSKNYMIATVSELWKWKRSIPTLADLELFMKRRGRHGRVTTEYHERILTRLVALNRVFGEALDCEKGFEEKLLNTSVVIELDGIEEEMRSFVVQSIMLWLFHHMMASGRRGKLRHITVLDEAASVFNRAREFRYAAGLPMMTTIVSQVREFGEGLIVCAQEPTKLSRSIIANSYTKIVLSLGSRLDAQDMAMSMGLEREQQEAMHDLRTGEAIVRLASRWTTPLKISIPFVGISKDVSQEELRERNRGNLAELHQGVVAGSDRPRATGDLTEDELKVLEDAARHPFRIMIERARELELSGGALKLAREGLVRKGLVKEVVITTGKRGGQPKLLEVTEKGWKLLEERGVEKPAILNARGGLEHLFWQRTIADWFGKRGAKAEIERRHGQGYVDVMVTSRDGTCIAVEVALSPEHQYQNVRVDLDGGCDRVILACRDRHVMEVLRRGLRARFRKNEWQKVRFVLVSDFLVEQ